MLNLRIRTVASLLASALLVACGGSNNNSLIQPPPPPPPADIGVSGLIYDGAVSGGTLFVFAAADVNAAIEAADAAADRAAALAAANPVATLQRDPVDGASYSLAIAGSLANEALFFVFDGEGAVDEAFSDGPVALEAVAIAGDAGSQLTANLTSHTTITAIQVRALLDPDGDGAVIDAAAIDAARSTASANTAAAYGTSDLGDELFPAGEDPATSTDSDVLDTASTSLGIAVRAAAAIADVSADQAMFLFAADAADGILDGAAPLDFNLDADALADLAAIADAHALGKAQAGDVEAASCSSAAASLRRACAFEVLDEFFLGRARCAHSGDAAEAGLCIEEVADERDEALVECGDVTTARLELCTALNDAIHEPLFGPAYAPGFVDPAAIGDTVAVNPYFPLIEGTEWVYEGSYEEDGEMITEVITITVTDRIKLIDGIRCRVVRDVVEIDGELVEDTDDWFAQDQAGNVWYCGEESKDYEFFEGDEPPLPELVAIDGSFKSGRDGDEAGILLPAAPVVGDIFRQEMSVANAEDVIEILATDGSEAVPAAACNGDCLVTRDFTPLEPDAEENKYYAPGIGKILEIDIESGDRVELVSVTSPP